MRKYLKTYQGKQRNSLFRSFLRKLSAKQKISIIVLIVAIMGNVVYGQIFSDNVPVKAFQTLEKVIRDNSEGEMNLTHIMVFVEIFTWIEIPRQILYAISDIQLNSIQVVADAKVSSSGIFDNIVNGLTIFAVIGILVKIIQHFLKTERYDSVSAFTGFFSYLGLLLLFVFSPYIVNHVVRLNEPITGSGVRKIAYDLDNQLTDKILINYKEAEKKMEQIEKDATKDKNWVTGDLLTHVKIGWVQLYDIFLKNIFTYVYFTLVSVILVSILSIPAFILAFMIKMLLSVMIAGTKLVFLVSLIPGFESTWKTFMMNILNVLLWAPIFGFMMSFITQIVSDVMMKNSVGVGQILWITIATVVLAFQAITLTTTAAGTIISGAGASMAGALGGLAAMNGVAIGAGVAKTAVGAASALVSGGVTAATGGASAAAGGASALKKFMK